MSSAGEFKSLEALLTRAQDARRWPRWRVPNTPRPRPERRSVFDVIDDWEETIMAGLLAASLAVLACAILAGVVAGAVMSDVGEIVTVPAARGKLKAAP